MDKKTNRVCQICNKPAKVLRIVKVQKEWRWGCDACAIKNGAL